MALGSTQAKLRSGGFHAKDPSARLQREIARLCRFRLLPRAISMQTDGVLMVLCDGKARFMFIRSVYSRVDRLDTDRLDALCALGFDAVLVRTIEDALVWFGEWDLLRKTESGGPG